MARSRQVQVSKSLDPFSDGSGSWPVPEMNSGLLFRDIGSYGLRQFGGWIREEFLRALLGREAQRVFREMGDNDPTIGAMLFAITQAMRKVDWRDEAANDSPEAQEAADFAHTIRMDMSSPWEEHVVEALSMLQFGFAPVEIVYKKRLGRKGSPYQQDDASSIYNDGKIGIRRLPIRGQETILRWFFSPDGQIMGLTQQPWIGALIDIPIEKLLLFRPLVHKNNPEGRSILRTAYRPWYFKKRFEELEAILFERMSGLPVVRVPNALLEAAKVPGSDAALALESYKKLVSNVRIDEQMGICMPSDMWRDANGSPTGHPMYDFHLKTPDSAAFRLDSDKVIHRYEMDILKTVLADFIDLGHQARGTQNLAISKVDMFYTAIEGWLKAMSSVHNRYLLPRVWALNAFNMDLLPQYTPDLPMRIDLDVLGKFILSLAQSGMQMFPDRDLENYIRGAAGMPDAAEAEDYDPAADPDIDNKLGATGDVPGSPADVAKHVLGLAALKRRRLLREATRPYGIRPTPTPGPEDLETTQKITRQEVDRAALAARPPTPGQRHIGNYPKGHVSIQGLQVSIENPKGSVRTGKDGQGKPWQSVLPAHYGYARGVGAGADGMPMDVYVGPNPESDVVFVIDQLNPDDGSFDEHKSMVGWDNLHDALNTYRLAFSDGRGDERIGAVHRVSMAGFKAWLRGGDQVDPLGGVVGKTHLNGSAALANGHLE